MQKQCLYTAIYTVIWICLSANISAQLIVNKEAIKTVKIHNEAEINTANMESSPAFIGDKVAFVYTESKGKLFDKTIDQSFFQLGASEVNLDNTLQAMKPFGKKINSEYHEGPMSYDLSRNVMYFTRSHKEKRNRKGVETDTFFLRIFTADLNHSNASAHPVNINVDNYSVCHPTISKDGKMMIFASDQPGGKGKMDLYVAYMDDNAWVSVTNLGTNVNSENNEVFPNLVNDSLLVFASSRPGGLGNLDLYVSKLENGSWSIPELLPAPFNTSHDDLGLVVRENLRSGYFASNRHGGKGNDDIYRFESLMPIFGEDNSAMVTAQVRLLDKLTLEPIAMATVTMTPLNIDVNNFSMSSYNIDMLSGKDPGDLILKLSPKKGQSYPELYTKNDGTVPFQIKKNQQFLIRFSADGYSPLNFMYDYVAHGQHVNIVLEPEDASQDDTSDDDVLSPMLDLDIDTLFENSTTGDVIIIDDIYFEYNSSKLDAAFTPELNALYKTMLSNANMRIQINAHTDSRGTADYNMLLSINRASAVRDFLITHDVEEERIKIKGFGETRLRNHCKDNIPCTDEEHRYNRRTEIVILGH